MNLDNWFEDIWLEDLLLISPLTLDELLSKLDDIKGRPDSIVMSEATLEYVCRTKNINPFGINTIFGTRVIINNHMKDHDCIIFSTI
jgi:hypothetical protein